MELISYLNNTQVQDEVAKLLPLIKKAREIGKRHVTVAFLHHSVVSKLRELGYEVVEEKDDEYEITVPQDEGTIALRDTC